MAATVKVKMYFTPTIFLQARQGKATQQRKIMHNNFFLFFIDKKARVGYLVINEEDGLREGRDYEEVDDDE